MFGDEQENPNNQRGQSPMMRGNLEEFKAGGIDFNSNNVLNL